MKAIGLYGPGPNPPAWASFGMLADFGDFESAKRLSDERGFLWVLQMGHAEPVERPISAHAARIKARLESSGLRPYVIAVTVREEWYEHWRAGEFADKGLPPNAPWGVSVIRDWAGRQHKAVKDVLGLPVVWVTTAANDNAALSPHQPIPAGVDVVAIDAYVPKGGSFAAHVAPVLEHAERATALPLVLVAQWFHAHGYAKPKASDVAAYLAWLARPRWVALLGFTGRSRPWAGITGLADLPDLRAAVDDSMGGK